ncbi:MAG: T9SS type A sorting domain-containing protein [Saprospiraceae bacterium]|nr:T9SS type A sorting domain-containing protein [Saprospiraceae bacterium]
MNNSANLKTLKIQNSKFTNLLHITGSKGPALIKGNTFTPNSSALRLDFVEKFDIVENIFDRCFECIKIYYNEALSHSNLIFKNNFTQTTKGITINSPYFGLALECNNHQNTLNFDWNLQEKIASKQGDDRIAAGNTFSRKNPEITYVPNSPLDYFYRDLGTEEPVFITGAGASDFGKIKIENVLPSKCSMPYPPGPVYPVHCSNGIKDANETGTDCGGSCKPCIGEDDPVPPVKIHHCMDGRMNGDETGVDCGGAFCPPCNTDHCNDGIRNHGEDDVDCGGPCPPCVAIPPSDCYDGIINGLETGVDCGGNCSPCNGDPVFPVSDPMVSDFIDTLRVIYGPDMFPPGNVITIRPELDTLTALQDNGNTAYLINTIHSFSAGDPVKVLADLQAAAPFVSVKAIHTLLSYTQHYTSDEFTSIIKNNPCVLSDPWISWIVYESNSLSSAQISLIKEAYSNGDACTDLTEIIRIKKHYMDYVIRQKIHTALSSENPDHVFVRDQLQLTEDPGAIYQIYESYIAEGDYREADRFISRYDSNEETDPGLMSQLSAFKALHQILMQYYYAGNRVVEMPASVFDQLSEWAELCYGYATIKSRAVLFDLYDRTFADMPECNPYEQVFFRTEPRTRAVSTISEILSVNPNPASDKIEVHYTSGSGDEVEGYTLSVKNVAGREVYNIYTRSATNQIPVSDLAAGVYYVSVVIASQVRKTVRFIKVQ